MKNSSRSSADADSDTKATAAKSLLSKFSVWSAHTAKRVQEHHIGRACIWVLMIILGYLINSSLDMVTRALTGPDQFLAQIHDKQATEFKKIEDGLAELRRRIPDGESATLASVYSAVASLRQSNQNLLQKLAAAQERNEKLSQNLQERSGVSGGYDFMLGSNDGLRLDETTHLGVTSLFSNYVRVRLSSTDSERSRSAVLYSGDSIAYTSADGQACKIILLAPNVDIGQATFDKTCVNKSEA